MSHHVPISLPPLPRQEVDEVVRNLDGLWNELRGARIFFTGATGFFGTWLLETLLAANTRHALGVEAVVLSREPAAFARKQPQLAMHPAIRWVRGSVIELDAALVARELGRAEIRFDMVVHLATESDNAATLRQPHLAKEVIADGTRRVLEFAVASGARRMLFTSSGSVCARIAEVGELLTEDHHAASAPLDQSTAYGISGEAKRIAEGLCATFARARGVAVVIARCFTFAGPGMPIDGKFAFGNFLRDALPGRPIIIQGDGKAVRSYLYATDLAEWLWTLLLRGTPGEVYNVGSESAVSIRALAEIIAGENAATAKVEVLGRPDPSESVDFYVPSTARIRHELGMRERIQLREAIRRTGAWLGAIVQD